MEDKCACTPDSKNSIYVATLQQINNAEHTYAPHLIFLWLRFLMLQCLTYLCLDILQD